jgi:hypothetical protein
LRDSIREYIKANTARPILFVALCLGGIILVKALDINNKHANNDSNSPSLRRATQGVVFLATPFRGTAFKNMPGFLLKAFTSLQDRTVTTLIDYIMGVTSNLDELTRRFIKLQKTHRYHMVMFWEVKTTVLLRKFHLAWMVSKWILLAWLVVLTLA